MQNVLAHKIQWSGSTVHSFTVPWNHLVYVKLCVLVSNLHSLIVNSPKCYNIKTFLTVPLNGHCEKGFDGHCLMGTVRKVLGLKFAGNKCVNIIKHPKCAFYSNCFEKNKGNSKAMWKTIKSLMSTKKSVCMNLGDYSDEHVVEKFNDYFTSVANELKMLMLQQEFDISKLKSFISSKA